MRCIQCGAELRPNARFCNVCGADQSKALAQAVSQAEGQPTAVEPAPASPAPLAQIGSEGDEIERAKRPPRIPRASDDEQDIAAVGAPVITQPVEAAISPANGATAPSTPTQSAEMVGDLPWPLPAQAVVAGRYQVQRVVSAAETQDGENVYRVVDLRGNEKCWSCGTTYAASDDPQRFCPECGADMLGHELTLHERIAVPDETPTQPLSEANMPPAPGGESDHLRAWARVSRRGGQGRGSAVSQRGQDHHRRSVGHWYLAPGWPQRGQHRAYRAGDPA